LGKNKRVWPRKKAMRAEGVQRRQGSVLRPVWGCDPGSNQKRDQRISKISLSTSRGGTRAGGVLGFFVGGVGCWVGLFDRCGWCLGGGVVLGWGFWVGLLGCIVGFGWELGRGVMFRSCGWLGCGFVFCGCLGLGFGGCLCFCFGFCCWVVLWFLFKEMGVVVVGWR